MSIVSCLSLVLDMGDRDRDSPLTLLRSLVNARKRYVLGHPLFALD